MEMIHSNIHAKVNELKTLHNLAFPRISSKNLTSRSSICAYSGDLTGVELADREAGNAALAKFTQGCSVVRVGIARHCF
jgi:hypothetical protein